MTLPGFRYNYAHLTYTCKITSGFAEAKILKSVNVYVPLCVAAVCRDKVFVLTNAFVN